MPKYFFFFFFFAPPVYWITMIVNETIRWCNPYACSSKRLRFPPTTTTSRTSRTLVCKTFRCLPESIYDFSYWNLNYWLFRGDVRPSQVEELKECEGEWVRPCSTMTANARVRSSASKVQLTATRSPVECRGNTFYVSIYHCAQDVFEHTNVTELHWLVFSRRSIRSFVCCVFLFYFLFFILKPLQLKTPSTDLMSFCLALDPAAVTVNTDANRK